jgi:class 3 adenylate cyclase
LGRDLAERIAGARLVELPGSSGLFDGADHVEVIGRIAELVTGAPPVVPDVRRLAAVLFTDIVGSTVRTAEVGDRRWREVLDAHDAACASVVAAGGGRVVKYTGDGILAVFDRPSRAVDAALALRDALGEIQLVIRAGVHVGEVEVRRDDVSGIAVNAAQRVQAAAQPGEVLVSRTVVDLVAGSGIATADRGIHRLKGVPGEWPLYAAARPPAGQ